MKKFERTHLFDLGGTLLDSTKSKVQAIRNYLDQYYSVNLDQDRVYDLLNKFKDEGRLDLRTRSFVELFYQEFELGPVNEQTYREFRAIEQESDTFLVPGSVDYLRLLVDQCCDLGIVTNSSAKNGHRSAHEFLPCCIRDLIPVNRVFFRSIGTSFRKKPETDLYLHALRNLGVNPELGTVVAYEDSPQGVRAAVNAGINRVIGIKSSVFHNDEKLIEAGASATYEDYRQICEINIAA